MNATEPMDLATARKMGLKKYKPLYPCKNGHISLTYTSNNLCMRCNREKVAAYLRDKAGQTRNIRIRVAKGDEAAVQAYAIYLAGLQGVAIADQLGKHGK